MIDIAFRPIDVWPGTLTPERSRQAPPFSARWEQTLDLLDRELRSLRAKRVVLQLALSDADLRLDGLPRATARPEHPGVILAFDSTHGPLKYATDVFDDGTVTRHGGRWESRARVSMPGWQSNVRAVALGLEALRKVDRYGITKRGEQYTGWKALPSGTPMPAAMSLEDAAELLVDLGEWGGERGDPDALIADPEIARAYYREAAKRTHPDTGGDPAMFARVKTAYDLVSAR